MSISLTNFLLKVNRLLGDDLTGTTTAIGNAGKTTLVDAGLEKYGDNYFGDPERLPEWWVYVSSQLRPVKQFTASSGTLEVYTAFSAQIASTSAYELHHFDRDKKIVACNQALVDCYPYFYDRVEDATTLDGKGASNNRYQVPTTFTEFPDRISKVSISGTKYTYTPITDYITTEISGIRYFYANITTGDDILLVGKTYLSQFTTDTSTTELSDNQANVVAFLAVSIFYRMMSGVVNATDSGRFDSLSNRYLALWDERKRSMGMPMIFADKDNMEWANV